MCFSRPHFKGDYKFLSIHTKNIVESRNVVFKEDTFQLKNYKDKNYLSPEDRKISTCVAVDDVENNISEVDNDSSYYMKLLITKMKNRVDQEDEEDERKNPYISMTMFYV